MVSWAMRMMTGNFPVAGMSAKQEDFEVMAARATAGGEVGHRSWRRCRPVRTLFISASSD